MPLRDDPIIRGQMISTRERLIVKCQIAETKFNELTLSYARDQSQQTYKALVEVGQLLAQYKDDIHTLNEAIDGPPTDKNKLRSGMGW